MVDAETRMMKVLSRQTLYPARPEPPVSVVGAHATSTVEHDSGTALVIVGTPGAVPSTGAQFTEIDTTFESRVTEVTAWIAKCQVDPLAAETLVARTSPR